MPTLQLTYFDTTGRGEAIRKTLSLGGVAFVDHRITWAEFTSRKETFPFGKVPVLDVDGHVFAETQGLLRYAARLAGLYPPAHEPVAAMLVDELLCTFEDLFDRLLLPSFEEKDVAKVKQLREQLLAGPLPHALRLLDTRLQQIQADPFFVDHATNVYVHEVMVWDYVVFLRSGELEYIPTTLIDEYKTMTAVYDKVVKSPSIHHYQQAHGDKVIVPRPLGTIKLTYFDVVGRGEHLRLALHLGGLAFEDERLTSDAFTKLKTLFPNEQLPVLSWDGRVVAAQSFALLRYVGRLTGLYPTTDLITALKIDEVLGHVNELDTVLYHGMNIQDEEKKRNNFRAILEKKIPESLGSLDKRIQHWNTKERHSHTSLYAVGGDQLTIADLAVYNLLLDLKTSILDDDDLKPYVALTQVYKTVADHPRVVDWYKTRPQR